MLAGKPGPCLLIVGALLASGCKASGDIRKASENVKDTAKELRAGLSKLGEDAVKASKELDPLAIKSIFEALRKAESDKDAIEKARKELEKELHEIRENKHKHVFEIAYTCVVPKFYGHTRLEFYVGDRLLHSVNPGQKTERAVVTADGLSVGRHKLRVLAIASQIIRVCTVKYSIFKPGAKLPHYTYEIASQFDWQRDGAERAIGRQKTHVVEKTYEFQVKR